VPVVVDAGSEPVEEVTTRARLGLRLLVRRGALLGHRFEVEEVAGGLRDETHEVAGQRRGHASGVTPVDVHRAAVPPSRPLERPQQGGLA
jgi:hypothetical protein